MTATDELRTRLTEQGIRWWQKRGYTRWKIDTEYGPTFFSAWQTSHDTLTLSMFNKYNLTPQQAIDATLGRGECDNKGNIERFICSECGCRLVLCDEEWEPTMLVDGAAMVPNFCPNCGRRVREVDE